jgi:hypothetical protein
MDTLREEVQEQEAPEIEAVEQEQNGAEAVEQEPVEVSAEEKQAREKGWVNLEEWQEQGKDPADWGGYRAFNKNGSILAQKYASERKHQEEIQNLNQFHKLQLDSRIEELKNKQVEAAEMADSEAVKGAQIEIEELQKQQAQIQNQAQPSVSEADQQIEAAWESENQWLKGNDPKAVYARDVANRSLHLTGQDFVDAIEAQVNSAFPPTNPNRDRPAMTDKASPRAVKSEKLTMDSLTSEERQMVSVFKTNKHMKKMTNAEILKMVENSRKGV